jgi:recombination protein RecA
MAKKNIRDDLSEALTDGLNKKFKGQIAYIPAHEETPTDLTDFLSTGCALLDLAISNRAHGGIAFGRITELTGLEGSGKSLVAAHMIAEVQKIGGVAVLIDTETAVNWDFFEAAGVQRDKLTYTYLDTVEDIFAAAESIITMVRESDSEKPVLIVIDSVAGATTKVEREADYNKDGYATTKAILMGKALRKITSIIGRQKIALVITNQLRQKMNAMPFADPWTTSGGKALAFHASTRIRLSITGKINKGTGKDKQTVGVKIKALVDKNRLGPPHRSAEFNIYFDRGIDDYGSWLAFLRKENIIKGTRVDSLNYTDVNGTEYKFGEKDWKELLDSNPALKEELYQELCKTCIMSYNSEGLTQSDVDVDEVGE